MLARQSSIDKRVAVVLIEDQGQVQEALGSPRTPRSGQDINTAATLIVLAPSTVSSTCGYWTYYLGVAVRLPYADGSISRDAHFVWGDGWWRHLRTEEQKRILTRGLPFEEFAAT